MKKYTLFCTLCLGLFLLMPSFAESSELPFSSGEKLSYEIYWTFIHAGSATLEVLPIKEVNGVPSIGFLGVARSTPFVDSFYTVRDRIESWADASVERSLLYRKQQREGSYSKDVELHFDHGVKKSFRYVRGKLRHTLDQPAEIFDPLSILFAFRKQPLYKTMRFSRAVTDGKVSVLGEAFVEGKETVDTPLGSIDCFRVRIDVQHLSGVFRKSDDAELLVWFSADERRLPVRVKSKVVVGHFSMDLVHYEKGQQNE